MNSGPIGQLIRWPIGCEPISISGICRLISSSRTNNIPLPLPSSQSKYGHLSQPSVRLQLLNSGRGLEAWLERAESSGGRPQLGDELILSRGPLSYSYKLFKIELHSAPSSPNRLEPLSGPGRQRRHQGRDQGQDQGQMEEGLEALRAGKSSEHLIDGRSFEGELQLHFYNRQLASSAAESLKLASAQPFASLFAVISVFISLTPARPLAANTTAAQGGPLDFLLDNLAALQSAGNSIELRLARRHLEALVPERRHYLHYSGSMSRPPCAESVDWILLNKVLRVEAERFGQLFERSNTNQENVRPVQALNGRLLRTSISNLRTPEHSNPNPEACLGNQKVSFEP